MRFLASKHLRNSLASEAPPQTPVGELRRSPKPLSRISGERTGGEGERRGGRGLGIGSVVKEVREGKESGGKGKEGKRGYGNGKGREGR